MMENVEKEQNEELEDCWEGYFNSTPEWFVKTFNKDFIKAYNMDVEKVKKQNLFAFIKKRLLSTPYGHVGKN